MEGKIVMVNSRAPLFDRSVRLGFKRIFARLLVPRDPVLTKCNFSDRIIQNGAVFAVSDSGVMDSKF